MPPIVFSLGAPTRFARLRAGMARAILGGLLLLVLYGIAQSLPEPSGQPGAGDAALYRAITDRVGQGEAYHAAAATEQRMRGYPLRPFTTMRQPLLAEMTAATGPEGARILLAVLAAITTMAVSLRLLRTLSFPVRGAAVALAASGMALFAAPGMWVWHELWAGLFVALALACHDARRWPLAAGLALVAALIREFALPLLPMMACFAWASGRRREAAGWVAMTFVAIIALGLHAAQVAAVAQPDDPVSSGWLVAGGWRFDLVLARHSALFLALPANATAVLLPLALFGWAGWRDTFALKVTAMLLIWLGAFLILGRPDNDYWGFLFALPLPIGLALAPAALRDLVAAAGSRRNVAVPASA